MDKEITITYETLFELLRLEKNRAELQQLSPTFFADVISYIQEKQLNLEKAEQKQGLFTERDKLRNQLDNIRRIIKELYEKRETKIISTAVNKSRTGSNIIDTSSLLAEERQFFEQIVELLDRFRNNTLMQLLYGQPFATPAPKPTAPSLPKPKETTLVRFVKPVPQFVGKELEVYGPFEEEDVANLPTEIADILVRKGRARAFE